MAITSNTNAVDTGYATDIGQTDGNEVLYKLNPMQTYIVDAIVTSAGTATLKVMTDTVAPTDFTAMSAAYDGTQTVNFTREVKGCSYVGLDVASGTWTVKVRRV